DAAQAAKVPDGLLQPLAPLFGPLVAGQVGLHQHRPVGLNVDDLAVRRAVDRLLDRHALTVLAEQLRHRVDRLRLGQRGALEPGGTAGGALSAIQDDTALWPGTAGSLRRRRRP